MIFAVVVVYNKKCRDSQTCRALLRQKNTGVQVIICDNSEQDMENEAACRKMGWIYLGGQGNLGLSRAYNAALDYLADRAVRGDILWILDDDTELSDGTVQRIQKIIAKYKDSDIMVPVLKQNGCIISPTRNRKRNPFFQTEEECFRADCTAIQAFNSGMLIRIRVYQDYRYDERLFLDGVDHSFLKEMQRQKRKITVIPEIWEQNFSGRTRGSYESALKRFRIYVKDSRILYEDSKAELLYYTGKRALHLCLMYRTVIFFKVLLENEKL